MKYVIDKSDLKNIKITATTNIQLNEYIGIWISDKPLSKKSRYLFQEKMLKPWWETDDLGRYCNHSSNPNTIVIYQENRLELRASCEIKAGEELFVDYKQITSFTGYIPDNNGILNW